ncbi:MAG TPA: GAF domain-containing protein, partial [Kamptonema sp.]|nr:GAF domain-containing protein [Kamptonema sp.]
LLFHEYSAELAMLCGDFEAMEQLIETVIVQAHSLLEKVNIYRISIQAKTFQNKPIEALAIAQKLLQQLGVTMTESPTPEEIKQSIQEIRELIGERKIEDFVDLPVMTEANTIAIIEIANSTIPAASTCGSPLLSLLIALSVKLSLRYGNIPASASSYVYYSVIICNFLQDIDSGIQFGQLALNVVLKLDAKATKPEVLEILGGFIFHRKSHIKESLPLLRESYTTALEVGNLQYAGYSGYCFCLNAFWCGQPLATVEQDTRDYYNGLVQINQLTAANWCLIYLQSLLNLLGFAEHPTILSGSALKETEFLPLLRSANDLFGLSHFYVYKLTLCFLFSEFESANNYALEAKRYLSITAGMVSEPAFYFYDSLIALGMLSQELDEPSIVLERVAQNQTKLQHWAHYAPMNHQHKVDLVEAEKCRLLQQNVEAIELYEKAISGAKENEYINEEALANELAAKFYLDWGKEKVAASYMQEAYYCYARWGAKAKVEDLEKRYPQLLTPILQQSQASDSLTETLSNLSFAAKGRGTITSTKTSTSISEALDLVTILKASQAISGEIELDKLLTNILEIVIANAGADKCVLLLKQDSVLKIVALIEGENLPQLLPSIPLESSTDVPINLINNVKRNLSPLVLSDSEINSQFAADSYIQKHQPKSVLCSPIINQGQLIGVLYLENNLTVGAFTSERIEVLNLICSQAAISLENARLYQESQQAFAELKKAQITIVQSEKMSALGNLVAGVAHEINNPTGFLGGNIQPALDYINELFRLLDIVQEKHPQLHPEVQETIEAIELDYIREDLPKLVGSMREGVKRIQEI